MELQEIKLFIFDMDGLLLETGRLAYQAYLRAGRLYDFEVTHDLYYHLTGRNENDIISEMYQLFGRKLPIIEWRKAMNEGKDVIFKEQKRVFKKKGVLEILDFARSSGYKIALASSNTQEKVKCYLEIENMKQYFDIIITGNDVKHSKPNPEIFLRACELAHCEPQQAIIFEDSLSGIKAADNANIKAILVHDDITDLPIHDGKYKIQIPLIKMEDKIQDIQPQFKNLLEVRDFLSL